MVRIAALLLVLLSAVSQAFADDEALDRLDARDPSGAGARAEDDLAKATVLASRWGVVVTEEMLRGELARMARSAGTAKRIAAASTALGGDRRRIEDSLARPSLVDRLIRERFALDPELHAKTRAEAAALRRRLMTGELDPAAGDARRLEFVLSDQPGSAAGSNRLRVSPGTFAAWRKALPDAAGKVSAIEEASDGFEVNVLLAASPHEVRVARYVVPKLTWDAWWASEGHPPAGPPGDDAVELHDAADGTPAGASPMPSGAISGSISSPADVDFYAVCGGVGENIALPIDAEPSGSRPSAPPEVFLLDRSGAELPRTGSGWTAPYSGVYFAGVRAAGGAGTADYLLKIGAAEPTSGTVDLAVSMTIEPDPVIAGDEMTLTVTMTNGGTAPAVNAEMLVLLPEDTTFGSITWEGPGQTWDCTTPVLGGTGKISCVNPCFYPEGRVVFSIKAKVDPCLESVDLTAVATALTLSTDVDPENNTTTVVEAVQDRGSCDDGDFCTSGDVCVPGVGYAEEFDEVLAPAVPPGWTATLVQGPVGALPWRSSHAVAVSAPNAMFTPDASKLTDSVLDSPSIQIVSPTAQVTFYNKYDLETGFDGGVFEINIGGTGFIDILQAGGSFAEGAYTGIISNNQGSPIKGRAAWTGLSNGFERTAVNLPATMLGQWVVLRWRMATDLTLGRAGQWIDSVSVSGRRFCQPGPPIACDDGNACTADACDVVLGCTHTPLSCDDANPCTDDACDPVAQCVHTNNVAACSDGNACTPTDACQAGVCVGAGQIVCGASGDVCVPETCDPASGCVGTTANLDTLTYSANRVDGRDLAIFARAWMSCPGDARYRIEANLDRQSPCVDDTDFHLFMGAFGRACPQ